MHHIRQLFILKNEIRWNSEYSAIRCIVWLLKKKNRCMKKFFLELSLTLFIPNQEQYLKEYTKVMRYFTEALDEWQGEKNIGSGYLLPTISL